MTTAIAAAHTAGHHASPLNLILLGIAAAALYMLSLYVWPLRRCPRCRGTRVNRGSTGRRFGLCKRCAGTGQVRRLGATTVHRLYWSALGDRLRERRRDIFRQTREHSDHPDT
jgi:hypothetical protein